MTAPLPDPRTWTAKQVAARLGVSETTVRTLYATGELPGIRIRRRLVFLPATIDVWLSARNHPAIHSPPSEGTPVPAN